MAQQYGEISDRLAEFIAAQHVFFVATAAREGRVNISPKGWTAFVSSAQSGRLAERHRQRQ